jgi:transposase
MQMCKRLGLTKALGQSRQAQLALWQIIARVIEQGSRLSSVRLHESHALAEVIGLDYGFNEEDLYKNLAWLSEHQQAIEKRLFKIRQGASKPSLFLYDVTSSYLEGQQNALGAYGYNRDGKKCKQQIVVGMLCDKQGEPVSVEVFAGNTQDPKTLASQIRKTAECFGCSEVTFVGDRGMIKHGQRQALGEAGFHYITAITKAQIEKLLKDGTLQMDLFDQEVCEIQHDSQRFVLRRNPVRAEEIANTRISKHRVVAKFVQEQNAYLAEHPKAQVETALKRVQEKITKFKISTWLHVIATGRILKLQVNESAQQTEARLDGCYVIVSDLTTEQADTKTIHERYKDLAQVERGFRMSKTGHLELRPIYVRSEKSTRGHVFVVMMAYLIRRNLERAWSQLDLTVEEGLNALKTLCTITVKIGGTNRILRVPTPRTQSRRLLDSLNIEMPVALPHSDVHVDTKRKLTQRR